MNLYKLHTNPEELYGDETLIPELQYKRLNDIISKRNDKSLFGKLRKTFNSDKKEINEILERIKSDPWTAGMTAIHILKRRWPGAEPAIAKEPHLSLLYAKRVLNGRFKAGEDSIATEADYSFHYARDIMKGRFEKGEPIIMKSPWLATKYAKTILKQRWPEAEPYIKEKPAQWEEYKNHFRIDL